MFRFDTLFASATQSLAVLGHSSRLLRIRMFTPTKSTLILVSRPIRLGETTQASRLFFVDAMQSSIAALRKTYNSQHSFTVSQFNPAQSFFWLARLDHYMPASSCPTRSHIYVVLVPLVYQQLRLKFQHARPGSTCSPDYLSPSGMTSCTITLPPSRQAANQSYKLVACALVGPPAYSCRGIATQCGCCNFVHRVGH